MRVDGQDGLYESCFQSTGDFPDIARTSFFKGTGWLLKGFTQSKQWQIDWVAVSVQVSQDQQNNSVKLLFQSSQKLVRSSLRVLVSN